MATNINKVYGYICLSGYLLDIFLQTPRGLRGQITLITQKEGPADYPKWMANRVPFIILNIVF